MPDPEQEIAELEKEIPKLVARAFSEARERMLAAGQSVLVSADGALFRLYPSGRREWIKRLPPATRVEKGAVIHLDGSRDIFGDQGGKVG